MPPEERLSWMLAIYPYIEASDLYSRFHRDEGWGSETNRPLAETRLRTYLCPGVETEDGKVTSYVGIAGIGPDAATQSEKDKRSGVFGYDRRIKLDEITDGMSRTIMVAETGDDLGSWARGGRATVRGVDPDRRPYVGKAAPFGRRHSDEIRFAGIPHIATVLIGDGSTRTFTDAVSPQTFEALATIAAGDEVGGDY